MQALKIHPRDTVAIAIKELHKGTMVTIEATTVRLRDDIPAGHKFSLGGIAAGTEVIKYGYSIGVASRDIEMGEWVHDHNLQSHLGGVGDYSWAPSGKKPAVPSRKLTFNGYVRPDGSVGIRNELWVVPMVGCVNGIAEQIVKITRARGLPVNIENVVAFPHPFGCSQLGGDLEHTQKILAGLVKHPNAGGVLLLWLGCENNTPEGFKAVLGDIDSQRIRTLNCQDAGDEIDTGVRMLSELLVYSAQFKRQPVPLSRLRVGFKCGGSDGFSGLTANPLAGRICDRVTGGGGTAVITEVPEMFGAETILFNRCVSEKVFKQAVKMVNGFKSYFISHNEPVGENPSPGNHAGGITTLEEKSLGCIQKGGDSLVTAVLNYGEQARLPGLNLLDGPGNDIVATTALAAAGCHLVIFTTGRGSPLGGPVPVIKISSNSQIAQAKAGWIDFDAGRGIEGISLDMLAEELMALMLETASGEVLTRNEIMDFRDMAIWKGGGTL